jgi:hypothetical protein
VGTPEAEPTDTFAERFAAAMGWDHVPTMTPEQRAEHERRNAEAQAAADEFYARRHAA